MRSLDIYCNSLLAGRLTEEIPGRAYSFEYNGQYLQRPEAEPISATLPLSSSVYRSRTLFPFFSNMLPEGANRKIICREKKIDENDLFALLSSFSGEDMNTAIHIDGDDFALSGGLSPALEKSDIYEKTGHPCREDFESFGRLIGLNERRIAAVLNPFTTLPQGATRLMRNSFLNEKMKRAYLRTVKTRIQRFCRVNGASKNNLGTIGV